MVEKIFAAFFIAIRLVENAKRIKKNLDAGSRLFELSSLRGLSLLIRDDAEDAANQKEGASAKGDHADDTEDESEHVLATLARDEADDGTDEGDHGSDEQEDARTDAGSLSGEGLFLVDSSLRHNFGIRGHDTRDEGDKTEDDEEHKRGDADDTGDKIEDLRSFSHVDCSPFRPYCARLRAKKEEK